jgi:hypothetical protein
MHLRHINIALLVAEAGGDPWAINKSVQVGRPGQISDLAEAFHAAGLCSAEANVAFDQARRHFEASWNHENGDHPINDSAEVQRVTKSLGTLSAQIPKIGVDLENIAAALAEAQRSTSGEIATLEGQLQQLDDWIGQALDQEKDPTLNPDDRSALDSRISSMEEQAIKDTQAALDELRSTRNRYTDCLNKSLSNLRTEGYDPAAIHGLDSDAAPKPSAKQTDQLGDLRQVTNQAVLDQIAKVRAAQEALNKAMAAIYTNGPGSPLGEAAAQSLPKLKADLAHALDDLGKIPDYNSIDPASVNTTPDGHFVFTYTVNGQPVQVYGQLKNGTGEFFDQATGTNYTFKDGKLVGMNTQDPGQVQATPEPLWTAITLAVGAPELKAGGVAAWQGLKTLFAREGLEATAGLTSEDVLPRAVTFAEQRAEIAEQNLSTHPPLPGANGLSGAVTHPGPPPLVEHVPPSGPGHGILVDRPPGEPHVPGVPDSPPPIVTSPGHPEFTLDNPRNYMPPELRALSEQHLTGSGETVLGPFRPQGGGPSYVEVAHQHGASYFDIGEAWNSFTPTQQLAANQHVLDIAMANRDKITLSIPFGKVGADSYTAAEIRYLEAHGYQRVGNNTLIPPTKGVPR